MPRLLIRAAAALVALPLVYFCLSLLGALLPGASLALPDPSKATPLHRVGLARGPIHYDLLLPLTPDSRQRFGFAADQGVPVFHPQAQWLIVGWGAEQFYTRTPTLADISPAPVLRAITGDRAVLRLDAAGALGDTPWLHWIFLTDPQLEALTTTIETSLERDAAGQPLPLAAPNLTQSDAFYRAKGDFNLTHTCNQWLGETLRAAGLPFGRWTPTPQSVTLSLWWNGL